MLSCLFQIEDRLSKKRYLTGNKITEADVRLFTTLIRFDPVYACKYMVSQLSVPTRYLRTIFACGIESVKAKRLGTNCFWNVKQNDHCTKFYETCEESDVRLFLWQCNKKRIVDCPNTWGYLRDLMQFPGMATDINFYHILHGYYVRTSKDI